MAKVVSLLTWDANARVIDKMRRRAQKDRYETTSDLKNKLLSKKFDFRLLKVTETSNDLYNYLDKFGAFSTEFSEWNELKIATPRVFKYLEIIQAAIHLLRSFFRKLDDRTHDFSDERIDDALNACWSLRPNEMDLFVEYFNGLEKGFELSVTPVEYEEED